MTLHSRFLRFVRRWALLACLLAEAASALASSAVSWADAGRPSPQAWQALALLDAAASHGLEPADYPIDALRRAATAAQAGLAAPPVAGRDWEQALTSTLRRYLMDLHQGRIDPRLVHNHYRPVRRPAFDAAQALHQAWVDKQLEKAVREAAPQLPMYERLRETLARYRGLVSHRAWQTPLPPLPGSRSSRPGKLEPGGAYAGLGLLSERLSLLGDLVDPGDGTAALTIGPGPIPERYDGPRVQAVRAFQQRHGLLTDGVIGRATWAQLNVPPAHRVRQLELAMERLRWIPLMQAPRMVVINIPEFVLRAYELTDGRIDVKAQMKVIVGNALDTRTPLFDEDMRSIEFSPYWNVPPSIARDELVPRLRRDPGYFTRMGFEFVAPSGQVDTVLSPAHLSRVMAGALRIRQRPGPHNALGDIKFVFPNQRGIFLHHTPAAGLFERDRRDFSHGCIRLENPVALAKFVLQDRPEWTDERIAEAMSRGESNTLSLNEPIPVLIAYGTALVKQGRPYFFNDVYGLDALLDHALRQRQAAHTTPPKRNPT